MLGTLLDLQYYLARHKLISVIDSDELPLAELLYFNKKLIEDLKKEEERARQQNNNISLGEPSTFKFRHKG